MDALTAINYVMTAIKTFNEVEPIAAQAIADIKPFALALYAKYTGQTISDDDLAVLEAKIDELHAELQQPLPPAQPGDPDYKAP